MKRNIVIIAGGDSAEFGISMQTSKHIFDTLNKDLYQVYLAVFKGQEWKVSLDDKEFDIDKNDFSITVDSYKIKFDFAYIAIHGTPGENGILQGYLSLINIPHSTCDVLSSALSFNKHACNSYLKALGYQFAQSVLLKKDEKYNYKAIEQTIGLPCFVKPNADGSSFGISKVTKIEELEDAILKAFNEGKEVIIEKFIDGLEVTCGLVKTSKEEIVFPITEVVPKNEFFDYEAKYDPNMAEEITPARISSELTQNIQTLSSGIYDALKCKGIVRIDYIIKNDIPYMLEANTIPGMTANSFIPKQVKAMGRELSDILTLVIEDQF
ncbi:D-alanine--D-alanine ligase [Ancylomarina euxinus]|uniref:D-alanine--D-alanine ligase n=1 Tax=Ancylomarina euxinus TaxID=2283627 RepID=A0A425Y517_9BACT|nr:D-alanine--D-alanine ligase [Ancylomarina euxinus]MCZ4694458.1 D-alanine--D-alanine ligase [Ancylomarina euxinus]MUP16643.1 D-alanine--D-alanine ligase [Ancylomarina euxinus]RRG23535.1 D-alanine--D-alanine ligase [Ancylomarina euxinus]